jgi:hypothetical protein
MNELRKADETGNPKVANFSFKVHCNHRIANHTQVNLKSFSFPHFSDFKNNWCL